MAKTLVTLLLDRSGSMSSCKQATIEGYNGYITALQQGDDDVLVTLLTFDSHGIDKVHFECPVHQVPKLTDADYQPRGGTPLIRCATQTIQALKAAVPQKSPAVDKVVVCIQTDGQENESGPDYSNEALAALIAERQAAGWQFNFMGAGLDAYAISAQIGISAMNTMSYNKADKGATADAFRSMGANTRAYASGLSGSTEFSAAQRSGAGDIYDPALKPTHQVQSNPVLQSNPQGQRISGVNQAAPGPLDLTRPGRTDTVISADLTL